MTQPGTSSAESIARWEHFAHDADLGVRGFGPTASIAFQQAALAMCAAIVDPSTVRRDTAVAVHCRADNLDFLLFDWLNVLIFEMAERNMIFAAFDVAINGSILNAKAFGEKLFRERHAPAVEVKGATFTGLAVVEDAPGSWRAQCVVDV